MRSTIYVGMAASAFVCLALILARAGHQAVVTGQDANPIETILGRFRAARRQRRGRGRHGILHFLHPELVQGRRQPSRACLCTDRMVAGSAWLDWLSPNTRVPTRALILSGLIAAVILALGVFFQNMVATIVSFAVIGIYAAFQMIVAGALFARLRGLAPGGTFHARALGPCGKFSRPRLGPERHRQHGLAAHARSAPGI